MNACLQRYGQRQDVKEGFLISELVFCVFLEQPNWKDVFEIAIYLSLWNGWVFKTSGLVLLSTILLF